MQKIKSTALLFIISVSTIFSQEITVSGSNSMFGLMKLLMQSNCRTNNCTFNISGKGSNSGFQDFIEGKTDIAMMSRDLNAKEIELLTQNKILYDFNPIAKDGLCVVTNIHNNVNELTMAQLEGIFLSNTASWKDVGGNDHEIKPIVRDKSSGTADLFKEMVLKSKPWGSTCIEAPNTASIIYFVNESENNIGFISFSFAEESTKCLSISFDDKKKEFIPVNESNIKNGTYKMVRKFNILSKKSGSDFIKKTVDYLKSPISKKIIESAGYINLD